MPMAILPRGEDGLQQVCGLPNKRVSCELSTHAAVKAEKETRTSLP